MSRAQPCGNENIPRFLTVQVADASVFLASHETELQRLRDFPGVTDLRLDFGCHRRDVAALYDYLPPALLALACRLGIGIELSHYAVSE